MSKSKESQLGRAAKHWLFVVHRWVGIAICLVIGMWFATGIVMMYVGYPQLTAAERLAHLPALRLEGCCVPLAKAWQALPAETRVSSVKLARHGSRLMFTFWGEERPIAVDAVSGERMREISASDALASARNFSPGADAKLHGLVQMDVWLRGHSLAHHLPVLRVALHDQKKNVVYVSSATGEVVRDASLVERRWNFVGAWLHWLYFIRGHASLWTAVLIMLSVSGLLLALTGATAGIIRWRFRGRFANGSRTPYREFHYRWHHVSGMFFAIIAITWLFSGLMSINPFGVYRTQAPPLDRSGYAGGSLEASRFELEATDFVAGLPADFGVRELEWRMVGGQGYLIAYDGDGQARVRSAAATGSELSHELPENTIRSAASALIPAHRIAAVQRLSEYDYFYYKRASHTLDGERERPLPVLRFAFDDPDESIVFIDPRTGKIVQSYNRGDKYERSLFRLLHSWDIQALLAHRPLWDFIVGALLLGGLALSVTGSVLGWRRLRLTLSKRRGL